MSDGTEITGGGWVTAGFVVLVVMLISLGIAFGGPSATSSYGGYYCGAGMGD